jgi:hypothetical protein
VLLFAALSAGCFVKTKEPQVQAENSKPVASPQATQSEKSFLLAKKKLAKNETLQDRVDSLLYFFDKMSSVLAFIIEEPVIAKGDETQRGVAYTICENNEPTILVKKTFYEKKNQKQLTIVLKHELTHAWFCRQGIRAGHDQRFRDKMKNIGEAGN